MKKMSAKQEAAVIEVLIRLSELPADFDFEVPEIQFDVGIMSPMKDEIALDLDDDYEPTSPLPSRSPTSPLPTVSTRGSRKISIRVPNRIVDALKAKAKASGTKYQTLINRALKAAAAAWAKEAGMAAGLPSGGHV